MKEDTDRARHAAWPWRVLTPVWLCLPSVLAMLVFNNDRTTAVRFYKIVIVGDGRSGVWTSGVLPTAHLALTYLLTFTHETVLGTRL